MSHCRHHCPAGTTALRGAALLLLLLRWRRPPQHELLLLHGAHRGRALGVLRRLPERRRSSGSRRGQMRRFRTFTPPSTAFCQLRLRWSSPYCTQRSHETCLRTRYG